MKKLNVTLNKNGDAKMMVMALLNGKLSLRMGRDTDSIITEIMTDIDVELSDEESTLIASRLIDAVNKFHDIKRFCKNKDQKYEKLLQLVPAEVGKETSVMSLIYSDVSEAYDTSELSTSEVSDVCCWLAAKSVLVKIPAMESLVAAASYKRTQQRGKSQTKDNIVVIGQHKDDTDHNNNSSGKNELMDSGRLKNTNDVDEMIKCLIDIILDDGRDDIYHQILSEVEIDFIREDWDDANKRLSSALDKYYNMTDKVVTMDVSERYQHLVKCVMSEFGKMSVLSDVYSDVSRMYDLSGLSVAGATDLLCWLVIFNLIYGEEPPATEVVHVTPKADGRPKQKKEKNKKQPEKTEQPPISSETIVVAEKKDSKPDVVAELGDSEYLTRGKNLNIFQAQELRNSVSTGNFCASRMFSIFG